MSDEPTRNPTDEGEPTPEALAEMPEINDSRFRRRPGRGHHTARRTDGTVPSEPEQD